MLWLTATLGAYAVADRISQFFHRHPMANPVIGAVAILVCLLLVTDTPYLEYFEGAQFVHFLLGPATIALGIPLLENLDRVRRALPALVTALVVGSITALGSAMALALLSGADSLTTISLAMKSVTSPIAMSLTESLGGLPRLSAVLVIVTGVFGAIIVTPLMNALRIRDARARGFAAGIAAHGLGTARAFVVHPVAGTFAGIGLALNGIITTLWVSAWLLFTGG
ncbi:MAG: LrgB family protein [Rhodospirillaceae bacterium]